MGSVTRTIDLEQEQREQVVAEARTWIRTPYHHMGRVKGAGADCYTLLLEVFQKIGLFSAADEAEFYPSDWYLHAREDHYKFRILRHAREMVEHFCSPTELRAPGDIVLLRPPTTATRRNTIDIHGGIITAWPRVVHAYPPCVNEVDATTHHSFAAGSLTFFSPWGKRVQD
jgi:cell wall-associated NlpC family hydrolase